MKNFKQLLNPYHNQTKNRTMTIPPKQSFFPINNRNNSHTLELH